MAACAYCPSYGLPLDHAATSRSNSQACMRLVLTPLTSTLLLPAPEMQHLLNPKPPTITAAAVLSGLGHVMRLTNLMRKAHCIVAKERRDNGKPVNLSEHQAAARNARIPFLLLERLEPDQLVALLRPVLIQKRIVIEHPQRRKTAKAYAAAAAAADVSSLQP